MSVWDSSQLFFLAWEPRLASLAREEVWSIALSRRYRCLGATRIAVGGRSSAQLHPRAVFRSALARGASVVVIVHNHPSGDPTPSSADVACTARMAVAGDILGIPLLDHLVIGAGRYFSFRDAGILALRHFRSR